MTVMVVMMVSAYTARVKNIFVRRDKQSGNPVCHRRNRREIEHEHSGNAREIGNEKRARCAFHYLAVNVLILTLTKFN